MKRLKKKSKKGDMSKIAGTLKLLGLTASFALLLVSFEWQSFDIVEHITYEPNIEIEIEEFVRPVPPKPKKKTTIIQLERKEVKVFDKLIDDLDYKPEAVGSMVLDSIPEVLDPEEETGEVEIVPPTAFPDVKAKFPGGDQALMHFLSNEIQYPEIGVNNGLEEVVYLRFVVRKNGRLTGISSQKAAMKIFEDEAIRALSQSPNWTPGIKDGKPVDTYFYLPVNFELK